MKQLLCSTKIWLKCMVRKAVVRHSFTYGCLLFALCLWAWFKMNGRYSIVSQGNRLSIDTTTSRDMPNYYGFIPVCSDPRYMEMLIWMFQTQMPLPQYNSLMYEWQCRLSETPKHIKRISHPYTDDYDLSKEIQCLAYRGKALAQCNILV